MRALLRFTLLLMLVAAAPVAATAAQIGSFAETGLDGWTEKSFKGQTDYRLVDVAGQTVLQATSQGAASGLVFETAYDPREFPMLSWRWQVENIIAAGDGNTKAGDDYAARVYVVFPHWFFPKTKTLNYIWANRLPKESFQVNAFTGNAVMIAVQSGPEKVGQWVTERRNIVEDFHRAFGAEPPDVGAIAIMTDTDNTGASAVAWYADIAAARE